MSLPRAGVMLVFRNGGGVGPPLCADAGTPPPSPAPEIKNDNNYGKQFWPGPGPAGRETPTDPDWPGLQLKNK